MGNKNNHSKSVKIRDRYIVTSIKFRINTDIFILGCCVYIYRIGKIEVPMTVNKKQQINKIISMKQIQTKFEFMFQLLPIGFDLVTIKQRILYT